MENIELAWAAGFFDGEGCITLQKSGPYAYAQIEISQAGDSELLCRFQKAVGVGKIGGPYKYKTRVHGFWRDAWKFRVNNQTGIRTVYKLLWPWLGTAKKQQFERVLKETTWKTLAQVA